MRALQGRDDIIAEQKGEEVFTPVMGKDTTFERFMDHVHLRKTYAISLLSKLVHPEKCGL